MQIEPIIARLSGSDICEAEGVISRAEFPVLNLCRILVKGGYPPDRPMIVYRGETLALRIRSIGEAAKLTIKDDNRGTPRLRIYRPGPARRGRQ